VKLVTKSRRYLQSPLETSFVYFYFFDILVSVMSSRPNQDVAVGSL